MPAHVTHSCARPPARARPSRNRGGGAQGARQRRAGAGHGRQARGQADADRQGQDRDAARGQAGRRVFRNVKPGRYRVPASACACSPTARRRRRRGSTGQKLPKSGYGYLTTRDGTQLAINVHLPERAGPVPDAGRVLGLRLREPRRRRRAAISPIANLLGYAVVDVNMRGTGCSGGAFDFFEPLQSLDGYDVIETVARQPWVARGKVGMIGVSYGGISQLFVAADAAAEPGGDHAAVGDRQHADDAVSGRHPQHRLHARVGEGPRARRQAGVEDRRPGVGAQAHPGRRQDLQGQPGAARRGDRPDRQGARATTTTCRRSPTRWRPTAS